jgi:membrane-associated phospholipid phosphatase
MIAWTIITKFGDAVIILPAAVAIGAWLAASGARRLTLYWIALFGIAAALVTLTKIAFVGWGIGNARFDFTGISGHTTFAMAVIPTLLYLAVPSTATLWRILAALTGIAFALLIGISRLTLHAHSLSEVVLGCALGLAVSLGFLRLARGHPMPRLHGAAAVGCIAALIAGLYAQAAPTQHWIERVALSLSGHEQPFRRTAPDGRPMQAPTTDWQRESASDPR